MKLLAPDMRVAIATQLAQYRAQQAPPGIELDTHFEVLLAQIYDSVKRVEYVFALRDRDISPTRRDPSSEEFDPLRASLSHARAGDLDEAAWLAFLSTHFGSDRKTGWRLLRDVYGAMGNRHLWRWSVVQRDPDAFIQWLDTNHDKLSGRFGNHRKYMTLKPNKPGGTGEAMRTYIRWIKDHSSHRGLVESFQQNGDFNDPGTLFDAIFQSMMANVRGFGRMGCFDYLCLLGKLGIFSIEPSSPYLPGSTGAQRGAKLLLRGANALKATPKDLDGELQELARALTRAGVRFSMQVVEDAICNWQKQPSQYRKFSG